MTPPDTGPSAFAPDPASDPTAETFARFLAGDDGQPVTMLNLLRFAAGGRDAYRRYLDAAAPLMAELGATVLYAGECATPLVPEQGSGWDAVVVTRYPSRAALSQLARDPRYAPELAILRSQALSAAVMEATTAWPGGPER